MGVWMEKHLSSEKVSVPEIRFRYMEYNRGNPFKRTVRRTHLYCNLCDETVLPHCISKIEDWEKIRRHLKYRHDLDVGEGIPIRLLSMRLFKKIVKIPQKSKESVNNGE